MKTLNLKRVVLSLAVGVMMTFGCTSMITAHATTPLTDQDIINQINNGKAADVGATVKDPNVTYSADTYEYYASDGKTYVITPKSVDSYKKDGVVSGDSDKGKTISSRNTQNGIDDVTSALGDLNPDLNGAGTALEGFKPTIELILGAMVILISIGMTIFSAFDICYIAFPTFRNTCENAKQTGQGVMASNKTNPQTGEAKLRFVSDDAQYAVASSQTVETGKNPFAVYFKKRIVSYMLLAILVFILLTGNITVLTRLAVNLVSGILELISQIG